MMISKNNLTTFFAIVITCFSGAAWAGFPHMVTGKVTVMNTITENGVEYFIFSNQPLTAAQIWSAADSGAGCGAIASTNGMWAANLRTPFGRSVQATVMMAAAQSAEVTVIGGNPQTCTLSSVREDVVSAVLFPK